MQPMTPKFRRIVKRLDKQITDRDIEEFDAAAAAAVQQFYIDNDPDYAAAAGEEPPAPETAFGRRGLRGLRKETPLSLTPGARAVNRVLSLACAEEARTLAGTKKAKPKKAAKAKKAAPKPQKAKAKPTKPKAKPTKKAAAKKPAKKARRKATGAKKARKPARK